MSPAPNRLRRYVEWSDQAEALARAFWPGPLTLVLPLRADAGLSDLVTAGLPSLAIRVPAHPLAPAAARIRRPVAAPSANPSGRISPTTAAHVMAGLSWPDRGCSGRRALPCRSGINHHRPDRQHTRPAASRRCTT
jgi:tRNA A37 threonylcarbamoyladenosine synthetase subunit TsaC/SUA5/YrdC